MGLLENPPEKFRRVKHYSQAKINWLHYRLFSNQKFPVVKNIPVIKPNPQGPGGGIKYFIPDFICSFNGFVFDII